MIFPRDGHGGHQSTSWDIPIRIVDTPCGTIRVYIPCFDANHAERIHRQYTQARVAGNTDLRLYETDTKTETNWHCILIIPPLFSQLLHMLHVEIESVF